MDIVRALLWLSTAQLLNYGIFFLIAMCVLGVLVAQRWRWKGIIALHFCVAILLFLLDVSWISAEMKRPDWDGSPDMDGVFIMGYIMRVFLFNTLLTGIGWYVIRRKGRALQLANQA
jgi:hypothetical protein